MLGRIEEMSTGHVNQAIDVKTQIEESILLGRLFPKERLVEDELMEKFQAKRHTVRAALTTLEVEGMVEKRRNVGAFVKAYSAKEVKDLYEIRELLETSALLKIQLPLSGEAIERLEQAQQIHDEAVGKNDVLAVIRANAGFHDEVFSLQPNAALADAIKKYSGMTHVVRTASFSNAESLQRSRTEHHDMIEALKNRDLKLLEALGKQHLKPSLVAYLQRIGMLEH